jgi:hypothetical protein
MTRVRYRARVQLTYGRRDHGSTTIPLATGKAQGARPICSAAVQAMSRMRSPTGSAGTDQARADWGKKLLAVS